MERLRPRNSASRRTRPAREAGSSPGASVGGVTSRSWHNLPVPTYRLDIEYEGTRYRGWQEQKNARSIVGELRRAVLGAGAEIVDLGGSGRTDAGVHALGQTAHMRLRRAVDPASLREAVNDLLPPDIHVLALLPAGDAFHARHAAVSRSYLYQISRRRTALAKRFVWWVKRPLDPERMVAAARLVEGRHDFTRFCERPAEQTSTVVVVERVEVATVGSLVLVRLVASHFLWKMVRRLVGALVKVGAGELPGEQLTALLRGAAADEAGEEPARWTAPPSGLFLERVVYPGEEPFGAIASAVPVAREAIAARLFTGDAARKRPAARGATKRRIPGARPSKRKH